MKATAECADNSELAEKAIEATAASVGKVDSELGTAAIAANSYNNSVREEAEDAVGATAEQTSDGALRDSEKQARLQKCNLSERTAERAYSKRSGQQCTVTDVQQPCDRCTTDRVNANESSELSTEEHAVPTPLRELSGHECSAGGEFSKPKAEGVVIGDQQYRTVHAECTSPTVKTSRDIIVEAIAVELNNRRYSCKQSTQQYYDKQCKRVGSIYIVDISEEACVRTRRMRVCVQQGQRRITHVRQ
jgi:hypothetical protein